MDKVRIGIAAIPARVEPLEKVIKSLLWQADEIFVSLNGFDNIPHFLKHRKIKAELAPNLGDFQKFNFLEGFKGYYITCDDDIEYGPGFVDTLIDCIERYDRKVVAGWHGSVLKRPFEDYYDKDSRSVYTFPSRIPEDRFVDVLGTGCMGFHTDTINPPYSIYERPSMADVFFAKYAREHQVPLVLTAHEAKVLTPIETDSSISGDSIAKDDNSALNVREEVNKLTHKLLAIPHSYGDVEVPARPARIGIVGRHAAGRWLKGGILKSCRMMADMVKAIGWEAVCLEIDTPIADLVEAVKTVNLNTKLDAVIIYTGDQGAQDFYACSQIVDACLAHKVPTAINLSFDFYPERDAEIREFMNSYRHDPNLYALCFTEELRHHARYADLKSRMIVVPKTIRTTPDPTERHFKDRRGVFLGDIAKLSNPRLTPDPIAYLDALDEALGGEPLYCVSQYASDSLDPELLERIQVFGYHDNVLNLFRRFRLYVHLQKFCTFEMLPFEALSSGLPVAYCDMPQSLNEYIGSAGMHFANPEELARKARIAYFNQPVWSAHVQSGIFRAMSLDVQHTHGMMAHALYQMIENPQRTAHAANENVSSLPESDEQTGGITHV